MSVEIVEKLFDAVHRNDVQTYGKCFTEDAEYRIANFPAVYGRKDIEAFGAKITPMFERVRHDVKHTWLMGNICVSELDVVYHRKDGKVVKVPCVDVIRIENNLVKSLHAYLDATPAFA
jgi:ketosteroid isomerase-like protein